MNPDRDTSALKGVAKPRSAGTIKRLQMYKNFKAKRTKNGAVIKAAPYQGYVDSGTRARVQPARGWFSNTKVITQSALQKFQVRKYIKEVKMKITQSVVSGEEDLSKSLLSLLKSSHLPS